MLATWSTTRCCSVGQWVVSGGSQCYWGFGLCFLWAKEKMCESGLCQAQAEALGVKNVFCIWIIWKKLRRDVFDSVKMMDDMNKIHTCSSSLGSQEHVFDSFLVWQFGFLGFSF